MNFLQPLARRAWHVLIAAGLTLVAGGNAVVSSPLAPTLRPAAIDEQFIGAGPTPPTQSQCSAVNRRCFNPVAIQNSYNLGPLYAIGKDGRGQTIAIIDSFGSLNMAHDLHVFDSQFGVQAMCGEEGVNCQAGMPTFTIFHPQGSPPPVPSGQGQGNTAGSQNRAAWALEVSLDVEWAHSVAPMANILLVTTPVAETQGVQGLAQMMNAEQQVIDNHMATVISQSFGTTEENFNGNIGHLRTAFESAPAAGVTVLASSGDGGTANASKTPTKNPTTYPFATVIWPGSDPLVTSVGGTYLCTNPVVGGMTADHNFPPVQCSAPGAQREIGWVGSGGGFSHLFSRPAYQSTLPAGSTAIPAGQRGVPDVAFQASSRTGVLIYSSEPGIGSSSTCPAGSACDGWWVIGGTSASSPQWAGIVAIADQVNGGGLGLINPALYAIGANPTRYANDFFDVTTGANAGNPGGQGFPATTGWDPVTGLGTPNAANLVPDLVAAVHGH